MQYWCNFYNVTNTFRQYDTVTGNLMMLLTENVTFCERQNVKYREKIHF